MTRSGNPPDELILVAREGPRYNTRHTPPAWTTAVGRVVRKCFPTRSLEEIEDEAGHVRESVVADDIEPAYDVNKPCLIDAPERHRVEIVDDIGEFDEQPGTSRARQLAPEKKIERGGTGTYPCLTVNEQRYESGGQPRYFARKQVHTHTALT